MYGARCLFNGVALLSSRLGNRGVKRFVATVALAEDHLRSNSTDGDAPPPLTQFNEREVMIRRNVHEFVNKSVKPLALEMDRNSKMDQRLIDMFFQNGFIGAQVSQEFGGSGSTFFDVVQIVEGLSKGDPSAAIFCHLQSTVVAPMLSDLGSKEQKDKYLRRIVKDSTGAFCLSEATAGSDAFAMETTATKDGNDYVINGIKNWVMNADRADFFLVFANCTPGSYKGITCFLVDRDTKGVSVEKQDDKLGLRAMPSCFVRFDDVRIPESAILGERGKGYKYAIEGLNAGRICIGAQMVGIAQGCFDATIPYLQDRKQFKSRIIDFQGMQHQVAQIATEIEAARLLVYNAARMKDAGLNYVKEASMAKLFGSQVAMKTTAKCVEWMGGIGFTKDFPAEKFYRDSIVGSIYEGTSNIQLNTIAKAIDLEYSVLGRGKL